ncbi:hypothetical protein SAMN05216582_105118 [Selenomonas ruminantium]|uniref:Uncharacterized protein n=1 Tax=Selenomonas ruminantium TaxID=971 RepID=A0A1M6SWI8_SELRU|nr:hypothetical protein [Selenomonas ruminantium]SHK49091.1 hypothetical protein SAMN05216582_105118 [Selenomonas ruminantium]
MAVKAPVAPVPPTPPAVPGGTLQNGGSVQESTVPKDKTQTHDERTEDQARQSVAKGNGALSKTTQSRPEKEQKPKQVDASGGASQADQQPRTVVVQNGLQQENPQQEALADAKAAANTQSQTRQQDHGWEQFASHGALFWGGVLLLMSAVVWFGIRKLMGRKEGRSGSLSMADIDGAAAPVPLPDQGKKPVRAPKKREQVETFAELRGMTPDEVLAKIAHDEEQEALREMRQARAEAKERLQKAGRIPVNPNPPTKAARQYREQVTADMPKEKAKPLKPVRQAKEEEKRFEVRI